MKVKNISNRRYIHGLYSIEPGAVQTVPGDIGKLWIRTKDIIEIKEQVIEEPEQIIEIKEPAKAEVKVQPKKVNKNAKRNSRRV